MFTIYSSEHRFNADIHTPVELYLGLRHHYRNVCLLESNDYHDRTDSTSIIGLDPLFEIKLQNNTFSILCFEDDSNSFEQPLSSSVEKDLSSIIQQFQFKNQLIGNGFLGRIGFEFSYLTESHFGKRESDLNLPDFHFYLYKHLIIIDHFKEEGRVISNTLDSLQPISEIIRTLLRKRPFTDLPVEINNDEVADFSDFEFESIVEEAKHQCAIGNVFQLVISNGFKRSFFGDDFAIYRSLRRLNPSPYLFYFDFEEYRLFGSSPEAQIRISNKQAEIHPIAGTVRKTGDEIRDKKGVQFLQTDEKENAEHTMLVDLARNDLSKFCSPVKVISYKEIQSFSHVFHIVSKVVGQLKDEQVFPIVNGTFPAGTLSGTPKPKALELISHYEKTTRDYYGGAIGIMHTNGDVNLAIVIRSILSKENQLHYRAGAGVVYDSIPTNESQEVHNKLGAIRNAIEQTIQQFKIQQDESCSY